MPSFKHRLARNESDYDEDDSDSYELSDSSDNQNTTQRRSINQSNNRQSLNKPAKKSKKSDQNRFISDFVSNKLSRYRTIYDQLMKVHSNPRSNSKALDELLESYNQVEISTVLSVNQIKYYKDIPKAEQLAAIRYLLRQSTLLSPSSKKIKHDIKRGAQRKNLSQSPNKRSKHQASLSSTNQQPPSRPRTSRNSFRPSIEKITSYRSDLYPRLMSFRDNNQSNARSSRRASNQTNQQAIDSLKSQFTVAHFSIVCSINQISGCSDLRHRELAAVIYDQLIDDRLLDPDQFDDDQLLNMSNNVLVEKGSDNQSVDESEEIEVIDPANNSLIDIKQLRKQYSVIYRKILALDWPFLTEKRLRDCVNPTELSIVNRIHGLDVSTLTEAQLLGQVFQLIGDNILLRPPELPSEHRSVKY